MTSKLITGAASFITRRSTLSVLSHPVELQVPDFSKGIVKKEVNLCTRCLESIDKAYIKFKREQIEQSHEQGRIHGHEHVHPH